jgi:membrane-bound ClpP family serine protease
MDEFLRLIFFTLFVTSCAALFLISLYYAKMTKYAIIAVSGVVMIAYGSHMISQGVFRPGVAYVPNLFDWMTLVLLGIFVTWSGFVEFYKSERTQRSKQIRK